MKRTDALDYAPGHLFTDGDPLVPIMASVLDASWLNNVQEEIATVIENAGIVLDGTDHTQLWQALGKYISSAFSTRFVVYAGNPNGHVAGVQGNAAANPQVFPTVCWDSTNTIWWVCSVTGNAAAAVWLPIGDDAEWPYLCTQTGGTANAPVLTTPAIMDRLVAGTRITWQITTGPSTGAVSVTVGAFGAKALYKDGPGGPEAVGANGELDIGNFCTALYDGVKLHLQATEMGTAALADATSNTGKVVAMSGAAVVHNLPWFADVAGTEADSGMAVTSNTGKIPSTQAAPVVNGNFPAYVDAAGSIGDSGTNPSTFTGSADAIMYRLGFAM